MIGYKVFTDDLCSPIQGGAPVWDGTLPHKLPRRKVDRSLNECGAGWNFCRTAAGALRIAGLWPNGRPSRAFEVEARSALERGRKLRAETLTIRRELTSEEVEAAIHEMTVSLLGANHADEMTREQVAWMVAFGRPERDESRVVAALTTALSARGLGWTLQRFDTTRAALDACAALDARAALDAWDAWDAWIARAARDAWNAWDARAAWAAWTAWTALDARATRAARDARNAWNARAALDAWTAWTALDARDARAARAALDARAARAALTVYFWAVNWWSRLRPDMLTTGLRDAYAAGLGIALPVGPNELGWAMSWEE